jgi:nicotinamidase-related amidase
MDCATEPIVKPGGLRYGPLTAHSVHLCIDMQRVFAEPTPWHTPWMARVLPVVEEIVRRHAERTVFTRFMPPATPDEMHGAWRRYYRRWHSLTREQLDPRLLELVPSLARHAPPAHVIDKRFYSPFVERALPHYLRTRRADAIVVTGAETDVCVLAAVLDAVDLGYRVVLAADAICSSSDETHDGLMTLYGRRFSEQIETAETDAILAAWPTK